MYVNVLVFLMIKNIDHHQNNANLWISLSKTYIFSVIFLSMSLQVWVWSTFYCDGYIKKKTNQRESKEKGSTILKIETGKAV